VIGLKRTGLGDIDVGGLLFGQFDQLDAQTVEVQA